MSHKPFTEAQLEHVKISGNLEKPDPSVVQQARISQAISLKRIADTLDVLTKGVSGDSHIELTNLVQHLGWEAGRSFQQGTRTDR